MAWYLHLHGSEVPDVENIRRRAKRLFLSFEEIPMNLKSIFLNTAGAVALVGMAASAQAEFLDFTVDEGSVPGAAANIIVADKLNGGYSERLTINPDLSISFTGMVQFTGIFSNEGVDVELSQLAGLNGYNMYAIFQGTGNFNPISQSFSIGNSTLDMYIDPDQNTSFAFGATGADGVALGDDGEDYLIAFATNLAVGSGIAGVPGAFQAIWDDFALTLAGEEYFVSPRPFHLIAEATGDFDQDTFAPGTFDLTGDVSAVFTPVPEPSSLALMGLALLGLGVAARRRMMS